MSQIAESATRQRLRVASFAAGGVAAVLFVQDVLSNVRWLLVGYSQGQYNTAGYLQQLWMTLGFGVLVLLVFAIGVGISLWRLAPVTGKSALSAVVVRGLLAAVVGAVLVFVVHLGLELIGPMSGAGPLLGYAFPWPALDSTFHAASMALQAAFSNFVQQAPVVVLIVVLTWLWLQKNPSQHAVSVDSAHV